MLFTTELYPHPTDADSLSAKINFLAHSINLQENDKVLWMLLEYFDERKKMGETSPEEALIDNANLRNVFIRHIVSRESTSKIRLLFKRMGPLLNASANFLALS